VYAGFAPAARVSGKLWPTLCVPRANSVGPACLTAVRRVEECAVGHYTMHAVYRRVVHCVVHCVVRDAAHRLRYVRQREEDSQRVRRKTRRQRAWCACRADTVQVQCARSVCSARSVQAQCTRSVHAVHMRATSWRGAAEEVRAVRMPCLRRGARLGGIFGEVARTSLLAKRDHLAVRHHGELITEHRLEQPCEQRRLLEQQLGQAVAAVPAIEAATVALYNLCALHGHSRQPMQVRRQPAALGLLTTDDRTEQRDEAGVRLVSNAAERRWREDRIKPAHAVLREERFPGAHARRVEGFHGARRAGCVWRSGVLFPEVGVYYNRHGTTNAEILSAYSPTCERQVG